MQPFWQLGFNFVMVFRPLRKTVSGVLALTVIIPWCSWLCGMELIFYCQINLFIWAKRLPSLVLSWSTVHNLKHSHQRIWDFSSLRKLSKLTINWWLILLLAANWLTNKSLQLLFISMVNTWLHGSISWHVIRGLSFPTYRWHIFNFLSRPSMIQNIELALKGKTTFCIRLLCR